MHRRRGSPQGWRALLHLLGAGLLVLAALVALWPAYARATLAPYAPRLHGQVVSFALRGFEPDFDPIYAVVLSLTLHDQRPAPMALPDATLVLDLYLESFQPDTTPLLPDLLHPNQTALHVVGFLQGQAVLVNRGGQPAEQGDALAEVFADSSVHLVLLHLQPPGASATAPELRLEGTLTLYKGGTQTGQLVALDALPRTALAVPPGPRPSWQRVVAGLRVAVPPMRGTAGSGRPRGTPAPANNPLAGTALTAGRGPAQHRAASAALGRVTAPARRTDALRWAVASGGAVLVLAGVLVLWRSRRRHAPGR